MTSFFSMTRALVARKRKIFALFFALAASIGLSWAQNPSGECGDDLTWEFEEATGKLTISGTGTRLDDPSWRHEDLNSRITSVSLPEGLTDIRDYVFANCEKLESITLPSGLTSIGSRAFMNCIALREITLPGSLTTLGEQAFFYCRQLESIKLPEGITTLGNEVFANCNNLRLVTLPPTLTTLGEGVFNNCGQLESITLPDGLTSIGSSAFSGCRYIESITLPEGVTSIGSRAFEYCGFESIKLPEGITTLETGVFSNCDRLQSVTLPPTLTSIGDWAFNGCWNLASVTLPESVTSIGAHAFSDCGVTSMTLPAGVTTIGEEAFAYCKSLTEFTNNAATPQTINANVFSDVTLSNITLNVPGTSKAAYEAADVWKEFGTKATIPGTEPAATVDGTGYATFSDALSHWTDGTTLTLNQDVTINSEIGISGQTRTLDLNGHGIRQTATNVHIFLLTNGAVLTIMDSNTDNLTHKFSVAYPASNSLNAGLAYLDEENGTVVISGGYITGTDLNDQWDKDGYYESGAIMVDNSTLNFEGGSLIGNKGLWGGAMTVTNGGSIRMTGGEACYNQGLWGSTISVYGNCDFGAANKDGSNFTMSGGSIHHNYATGGFTIHNISDCRSISLTLTGGSVRDNYSAHSDAYQGSAISVDQDNCTINISGNPVVTNNLHNGDDNSDDMYIANGKRLTINGALTDGANIGIRMQGNGTFTSGYSTYNSALPSKYFSSDVTGLYVNKDGSEAVINNVDPTPVTLPKAVEGLVYNSEAQTLITAGEAAGYTFQYKVGENGEYSTDLPTAINAGSYTVYYKATAEGKQDITGSVEVSIAKADIDVNGKGKFSVADDKVVYFSKGNLQYNSNTQAWQFAENQYDYVGDAAGNTSITEGGIADNNGTVDLFCWVGASSTWTGLKQYGITALDYDGLEEADGYGNSDSEALKSDWGTTMGEGWFTLSEEQWIYLFYNRTDDKAAIVNSVADCRYTKATINTDGTAVMGIILFPDGGTFAASEFTEVGSPNTGDATYTTTCTTAQWNALQTKGCVFLPAAGDRDGARVGSTGSRGYYWSSSANDMSHAHNVYFNSGLVLPANSDFRNYGYSVRLVTEIAPASASSVTLPQAVKGLIANGEAKTLITAGECEGGTFYYSLDKENWSTTLPTGTGAQDYTVYYYVKGDANHNDSEVNSLTASIGTLPQALLGIIYTGEAQTLVTAGDVEGFTFQYKVGENGEYSTDLPTAINAGTYTVYYKATAAGEQDITGSVEVSIAKADINLGGSTLKGAFSVADGKAIYFSKGNLQATTADLGTNWTWAFAANQYDYVGNAVANTMINGDGTVSENGTVDLFGWSTAATKYGIHLSNIANYYSGDFKDWGATIGDGWFTLSTEQWTYLFDARTGDKAATVNSEADCRYTKATINTDGTAVKGIILFPDGGTFAESEFTEVGSPNTSNANYTTTTCTTAQWNALQAKGCVFLPITGYRYLTSVSRAGDSYGFCGYYWSSTSNSGTDANLVYFAENVVDPVRNNKRNYGQSVRLVTETALASSVTLPEAVEELAYSAEKQALISAGECADGTFLYKVGENGTWVDTLPKVTDAGTYQVYYKIQGDANHNDYIAAEPIEVSIAKAALTITAENKEVVYGFAAPGFSVSYSGLKGSDLPADVLTGELSYACDYTVGSNVASYDITPSGQTSANYDITYVKGTLVVYKADPAFTDPTANTLTYNGGAQTLIAAGTTEHGTFEYTFTPNDDESWNTALPQAKNADTYGVYYRVVGDANHNDYESADAVVVTIAKAALTATADNKSVIYGDAVPTYTVTYEGWQGEDNADVLSGTIAYACEYAPTSIVGDYTITPSGVSNPNYAITFVNGKVTVSKAPLTITADNKEVTYGDEAPAFTASYEGWKNEDDETVVSGLTLTSEYVLTSNVGEYDIVPADATAQNYAITFVNGTLTVNRAALMITAEDKEVTYGDEAPAFTASYEGWKNEDNETVVSGLTLTSEYVLTSNVGEYDIVPANATAQNYAISYTNGTLTVNQAALMITAEDKEVTYGDEAPAFTASYEGFKNEDNESVVSGLTLTSEYVLTSNVGEYDIVPADAEAQNYAISYTNGTLTVNQAPLTITAEDKTMFYGNEAPEFTVTYEGWKNEDDESVVSGLKYTCDYQPGSYIGAYSIEPNSATAQNYAITFVNGTLTVNKAAVIVSGAKVQIAKFEDGTTDAVILDKGILNGVMLNDPVDHITTATFSDATVGEGKTIKVFYELSGNPVLLLNYDLILTAEDYIEEGTIIENFIPDNNPEKEDDEAEVKEGIEVHVYGYCDGSGYSLRYHLNSGNPDQYKIEFADPRFEDVDWTDLETPGKDGTININIPVDLPTGDYTFTATFRDSRFTWLESKPLTVTFHVNLPETYVVALFDDVMAVVDTCECLTDIQWYHRADASQPWTMIEGATGYYYKQEGGLSGEYFIHAKMNGVDTYTCPQDDMTLYGDTKQAKVRAYPNPVVNTTTVTIENSYNYEHTLRVVNLMGNEMMTTSFEGNETTVDMDGFVQGNYMISVDGIVVKVMKQ